MAKIVGVKFKNTAKIYYFAPEEGVEYQEKSGVIVETAKGLEYGTVVLGVTDMPDEKIVHPLKPIIRKATEKDEKAVAENLSGRASQVEEEIKFVLDRESDCSLLLDMLEAGELPLRVTHNDTKLNNVMFDNETNEAICVVDLDTVMPGLSLYDFGDSIRFGANTASEDEKDVTKVTLSLENFRAYTLGYLTTAGESLTKNEIDQLVFSSKLMTLECGMRFLGDFINGDVYFKTEYPEHNLVRCRTQLAIVADIEKKMDEMKKIVCECCKELGISK